MQTQDIKLTKGQEALYNELTKGKRITRKQHEVLIKIIYNYTFSSFYYKVQGIVSSYHFSYQQGEKEPEHSSFHFPGEQQPLSQLE